MMKDFKIQDIALAYIRKASPLRDGNPFTKLATLHPSIAGKLLLAQGELVVVSTYFTEDSWYAFTTRRIVSWFRGDLCSIDPTGGIDEDFGNFKGLGSATADNANGKFASIRRAIATINAKNSSALVRFEFETGEASMLPIYAARYWNIKHRAIDKLMTTAEREAYLAKQAQAPELLAEEKYSPPLPFPLLHWWRRGCFIS